MHKSSQCLKMDRKITFWLYERFYLNWLFLRKWMSFVAFIEFPRKVTSSNDNQLTDHINFAKNCYKTMFDKNRNESYTLETSKKSFAENTVFELGARQLCKWLHQFNSTVFFSVGYIASYGMKIWTIWKAQCALHIVQSSSLSHSALFGSFIALECLCDTRRVAMTVFTRASTYCSYWRFCRVVQHSYEFDDDCSLNRP